MIIRINSTMSISKTINLCNEGDEILLENGIYNEKVYIIKNNIKITGESKSGVIIRNGDFYHKIMADFNECNTFRTYTMYIGGNNIIVKNLTIENTSTPSSKYGQAVALHADGTNLTFINVHLISAQDTLFTGPLPKNLIERYNGFLPIDLLKKLESKQTYINCDIEGDVDFIFGCATVLFEECNIISLNSKLGYICAPAHYQETPFGFLFNRCNLISNGNVPSVFLARPWRDYGIAAFIDCIYGEHILQEGFNKWDNTNRDKTARFFEYAPNIDKKGRVSWATELSEEGKIKYLEDFRNYMKK